MGGEGAASPASDDIFSKGTGSVRSGQVRSSDLESSLRRGTLRRRSLAPACQSGVRVWYVRVAKHRVHEKGASRFMSCEWAESKYLQQSTPREKSPLNLQSPGSPYKMDRTLGSLIEKKTSVCSNLILFLSEYQGIYLASAQTTCGGGTT